MNLNGQIKVRIKLWEAVIGTIMVLCIAGSSTLFILHQPEINLVIGIVWGVIGAVAAYPLVQLCVLADKIVQKHAVKSYYIEDCGEVIKLHGTVRLEWMDKAYKDLLSVRPGYKISRDCAQKYECTLAAVKASPSEIKAKIQAQMIGIEITTI